MTTTETDREFFKSVGARLKAERTSAGLTQAKLAEKAGVSPNFIARLERGELGMSLLTARKLSQAFGVGVDDLLLEAA